MADQPYGHPRVGSIQSSDHLERPPSPSGSASRSLTHDDWVDIEAINRDMNYRPSQVEALTHDDPLLSVEIDRYGFPMQEGSQINSAEHRAQTRKENIRLKKWQEMLFANKAGQMHTLSSVDPVQAQINQWNLVKNHKKLKTRIRKGIPQAIRSTVWQNLCGARERRIREQKKYGSKHLYRDLVENRESPFHLQLWKDIFRTYRKHARLGMVGLAQKAKNESLPTAATLSLEKQKSEPEVPPDDKNSSSLSPKAAANGEYKRDEEKDPARGKMVIQDSEQIITPQDLEKNATDAQQQLYNVLKAFSLFRPDIGYCQGMQSISALLLMYMTEEETFWVLASLADDVRYQMEWVWRPTMPAIQLRFYQMERLVRMKIPRLARHMEASQIVNPSMYQASQWFITVFLATSMPFDVLSRVWDVYLSEGLKTIYRVGLGILKYYEKELIGAEFEDMITIFREGPAALKTEEFMNACFRIKVTHGELAALERQFDRMNSQSASAAGKKGKKGKKG